MGEENEEDPRIGALLFGSENDEVLFGVDGEELKPLIGAELFGSENDVEERGSLAGAGAGVEDL